MNNIVCHLTSVHPATDGRIFEKECTSLAKNGYEVYLIAPGANSCIINNVHIIGVPIRKKGRIYRIFTLAREVYLKALSIDASIYHFHDPELLIFGLKLKRKGKKVIFDSHEDVPNDIKNKRYLNPLISNFLYWIYRILEPIVISKFDAVISVTPHIINKLNKLNKNTYQITNYPIINSQIQNETKVIEKFSNLTIFFAGGVNSLWMHENIIKALGKINLDIKYIIAGPSSNDYLEKLKLEEAWDKVDYIGKIPRYEVENYYLKSHIGIALPNYTNAGGGTLGTLGNTKIFEIMLSGLPIICSDFILWKQIVEGNKCGICVNPNSIDDIANAILQLINNINESNVMGMNGKNAVLEKYNWSTQEYILLDVYKKLN